MNITVSLKLYIDGLSERSLVAQDNLSALCAKYFEDNYDLEVIDVRELPNVLIDAQIVALPTLDIMSHGRTNRLVGDLSKTKQYLNIFRMYSAARSAIQLSINTAHEVEKMVSVVKSAKDLLESTSRPGLPQAACSRDNVASGLNKNVADTSPMPDDDPA